MVRGTRTAEELSYGSHDQVVYLSNVSWEDYERIDALRGESAIPRLTYVEGMLELLSPGTPHESDKTKLARIFEAYLEHLGIPAEGVGSWTVKDKKRKLGAEADECYVFTTSPVGPSVKAPDLVIEVIYCPAASTSSRCGGGWVRRKSGSGSAASSPCSFAEATHSHPRGAAPWYRRSISSSSSVACTRRRRPRPCGRCARRSRRSEADPGTRPFEPSYFSSES